jgi:hypothetical protein
MSQVPTAADRPYVREHFEAILNVAPKHLRKYLRVDDCGVWPNLEDDAIHPAVDPLLWQPQEETDGDPVTTPALPFPFAARELAAFMVAGVGSSIQECFGDWNSGPDPALLYDLGRRTVKSREALIQAYELYRRCEQELEKLNSAVVSSFEEADTRFETARHSDQEKGGVDRVMAEKARWRALEDGQKEWRQAMVRALLGAASATGRSGHQPHTRWSDAQKKELSDYRETHGTKAAAETFRISAARVRRLLPKATKRASEASYHDPFKQTKKR